MFRPSHYIRVKSLHSPETPRCSVGLGLVEDQLRHYKGRPQVEPPDQKLNQLVVCLRRFVYFHSTTLGWAKGTLFLSAEKALYSMAIHQFDRLLKVGLGSSET